MGARLLEQSLGACGIALQHGMLGKLAQIVRGNPAALGLHGARQLVKHSQRVRPVTRLLMDAHQMIERGVAVLARRGELLEEPLGAVHETGARVIERERRRRAVPRPPTASPRRRVWMAIARSTSPRRRNTLPKANWISTASPSTSAMRAKTSAARSKRSLMRWSRPT
jgi:hypothetical protein